MRRVYFNRNLTMQVERQTHAGKKMRIMIINNAFISQGYFQTGTYLSDYLYMLNVYFSVLLS
jgi:hypothetical protein